MQKHQKVAYAVAESPLKRLCYAKKINNGYCPRHQTKTQQKQCSTSSTMLVIIYCYIGCKDKATTWYLNGFPDGSDLGSTI